MLTETEVDLDFLGEKKRGGGGGQAIFFKTFFVSEKREGGVRPKFG